MAQAARLNLRLQKELKLLLADPPPAASFPSLSDSSSLTSIDALLQGPEGSVYANGVFKIKIQIPERYPFQPPIVTFATPIYHPNIDNGGRICLDILNLPPKGTWQPSLNIWTVLTSIGLLLNEPNPDDGLMHEASRDYKYNRQAFDQNAKFMTEKYAKAGESAGPEGRHGNQSRSCPSTDNIELEGPNASIHVTEQFVSPEESSGSSSKTGSSICEAPINYRLMATRKKLSLNTSALSCGLNSKIPSSDLPNPYSSGLDIPTLNKNSQTSSPSKVEKVSKTFTGSLTGLRHKKAGFGPKSSVQHLENEKENLHPVPCFMQRDEPAPHKRVGKQVVVDIQKPGSAHPKLLHSRNDFSSKDCGQNPDPDFVDDLEQCSVEGRVRVESTIVLDSEDSEDESVPVRSKASTIAKGCLTRKRKSGF